MKTITFILLSVITSAALAGGSAVFTGRMEAVQTVGYQAAWRCEYMYNGQTFTRVYRGSCPYSFYVE
jgi:hypothetical protein